MKSSDSKIILVSQECNFSGAAMLAEHLAQELKRRGYHLLIICNAGGPLLTKMFCHGITCVAISRKMVKMWFKLAGLLGYRKVITNTTMAGYAAKYAKENGMKTVSLVHELSSVIHSYGVGENAEIMARSSDFIVFPNEFVMERFTGKYNVRKDRIVLKGQGLYSEFSNGYSDERIKGIRNNLNLPDECKVVIAVGMGDRRKGLDLFVDVAIQVRNQNKNIFFIWVGSVTKQMQYAVRKGKKEKVIFIENTDLVEDYFRIADLFLMTSREDPFPSVVLEAIYCGVPVIGFDDAGGFRELPKKYVEIVPFENTRLMSERAKGTLQDTERIRVVKEEGFQFIRKYFSFKRYVDFILELL